MSLAILPARPDPAALIRLATDACTSPATRRAYRSQLERFFAWLPAGQPLTRALVQSYRAHLIESGAGPQVVNQALSAIRKLAAEAAAGGLMDEAVAQSLDVPGVRRQGVRQGRWLTAGEVRQLLDLPSRATLRGKRDLAILALTFGGALRRGEAAALTLEHLQVRDGRLLLVDIDQTKGGRVRTVPLPRWAAVALTEWIRAAGIEDGPILRSIDRAGRIRESMTTEGIWYTVRRYARQIGVDFSPHDLRRTFGKLARKGGSPIEQIQFTLGHASVRTTEAYLGGELNLDDPACDRLGV